MTIKIGLLGLGTVGGGVIDILRAQHPAWPVQVTRAAVRHITPARQAQYSNIPLTTDAASVVADSTIDVIIEVMGGVDPTLPLLETALHTGKHVISANKDLIAQHGEELAQLALAQHVGFYYEAAVMGVIPILHTLAHTYPSDQIQRIVGIANGTSNFILTQTSFFGARYTSALREAQAKGFAEADPTNDVSGLDAAYKLAILTRLAFGVTPTMAQIPRQGIDQKLPDAIVKPLIIAERRGPRQLMLAVGPYVIKPSNPLSGVNGANNAVLISSTNMQDMMLMGPGAGARPTASAVLADLADLVTQIRQGTVPDPYHERTRSAADWQIIAPEPVSTGIPVLA